MDEVKRLDLEVPLARDTPSGLCGDPRGGLDDAAKAPELEDGLKEPLEEPIEFFNLLVVQSRTAAPDLVQMC